jgi:hypothetical protein
MKNLSNHRENNKLNIFFVGMILKHVNGGHHGSLQRRCEYNLPVNAIDDILVSFTLHNAYFM